MASLVFKDRDTGGSRGAMAPSKIFSSSQGRLGLKIFRYSKLGKGAFPGQGSGAYSPSKKMFLKHSKALQSEGQITDFFRTPPLKSQKNHTQKSQNHNKITSRKH